MNIYEMCGKIIGKYETACQEYIWILFVFKLGIDASLIEQIATTIINEDMNSSCFGIFLWRSVRRLKPTATRPTQGL